MHGFKGQIEAHTKNKADIQAEIDTLNSKNEQAYKDIADRNAQLLFLHRLQEVNGAVLVDYRFLNEQHNDDRMAILKSNLQQMDELSGILKSMRETHATTA